MWWKNNVFLQRSVESNSKLCKNHLSKPNMYFNILSTIRKVTYWLYFIVFCIIFKKFVFKIAFFASNKQQKYEKSRWFRHKLLFFISLALKLILSHYGTFRSLSKHKKWPKYAFLLQIPHKNAFLDAVSEISSTLVNSGHDGFFKESTNSGAKVSCSMVETTCTSTLPCFLLQKHFEKKFISSRYSVLKLKLCPKLA